MSSRRHLKDLARMGRFSVVGVMNTGIDFVVFLVLVQFFQVPLVQSNIIAFSVALANSYVFNLIWTFHDNQLNQVRYHLAKFVFFCSMGAVITTSALWLFVQVGLVVLLAKLISVLLGMIWNYVTMRRFVFAAPRAG